MKHLSFNKVEVFLVAGTWFIASGLVVARYFTATTPTEKSLSVLILILILIATGWYVWNAIHISKNQKILEECKKQLQAYERTQENIDKVAEIVSKVQS